jgi:glycosyltransferase involved in cell wall biosynthesis
MKQQPLVSILINNYNKQNYCKQALKSAINQNYKNIEVIFYDDRL